MALSHSLTLFPGALKFFQSCAFHLFQHSFCVARSHRKKCLCWSWIINTDRTFLGDRINKQHSQRFSLLTCQGFSSNGTSHVFCRARRMCVCLTMWGIKQAPPVAFSSGYVTRERVWWYLLPMGYVRDIPMTQKSYVPRMNSYKYTLAGR